VAWINVVLKTDQWQALLNKVMHLTDVKNAGNILTGRRTISFSNSQNRFCSKESFDKILHVGKLRLAKFRVCAPDFLMTQINNSRQ
jgi:hypothetical protein